MSIKVIDVQQMRPTIRVTSEDVTFRIGKVLGIPASAVVVTLAEWRGVTKQAMHMMLKRLTPTSHRQICVAACVGGADLQSPQAFVAAPIPGSIDIERMKRLFAAAYWDGTTRQRFMLYPVPARGSQIRAAVTAGEAGDDAFVKLLEEFAADQLEFRRRQIMTPEEALELKRSMAREKMRIYRAERRLKEKRSNAKKGVS